MPNFEVLDARIASALNNIIHSSHLPVWTVAQGDGVPRAGGQQAAADSRGSRTSVCASILLIIGSGTRRGGRTPFHDLDFGVQIDSIEQPVKSNSMGSGNMSHRWTSSFHNHLDYSLIVFKHIQ